MQMRSRLQSSYVYYVFVILDCICVKQIARAKGLLCLRIEGNLSSLTGEYLLLM